MVYICGICGQNGHNRRTCPQAQPRGDNGRTNARDNDARNQNRNPTPIQEIQEDINLLQLQQMANRLISVVMRRENINLILCTTLIVEILMNKR